MKIKFLSYDQMPQLFVCVVAETVLVGVSVSVGLAGFALFTVPDAALHRLLPPLLGGRYYLGEVLQLLVDQGVFLGVLDALHFIFDCDYMVEYSIIRGKDWMAVDDK